MVLTKSSFNKNVMGHRDSDRKESFNITFYLIKVFKYK